MIGSTNASGVALGFRVFNLQPNNPREGDIWVHTETKINSWVIDVKAPEPKEGVFWIQNGSLSNGPISVLKQGNITVYPVIGYLYTNGKWTSVPTQIYLGGQWKWWQAILYNKGDEQVGITGGWEGREESSYYGRGKFRLEAEDIMIEASRLQEIYATTKKPIDITGYSKMIVNVTNLALGSGGYAGFGIAKQFFDSNRETMKPIPTTGLIELDIEKYTGEWYPCVNVGTENEYMRVKFDSVILE